MQRVGVRASVIASGKSQLLQQATPRCFLVSRARVSGSGLPSCGGPPRRRHSHVDLLCKEDQLTPPESEVRAARVPGNAFSGVHRVFGTESRLIEAAENKFVVHFSSNGSGSSG
ncbi:hypothetical protein L596_002052 [Steinernema carpocapsae]|uniref:Uncharacterized protein n=1 Tax=Steinernema carpocapsae TaxID=34508 RepID=A0A4U8UNF2_STECR|nr:hypothetical protein L596_002052 [Steinernema carpocapsae]